MPVINRLPIGGGGASDGAINIFTQIDEPDKKDGIWIQTDQKCNKIQNIISADSLINTYDENLYGIISINGYLYIYASTNNPKILRYDLSNNSFTHIATIDYSGTDTFFFTYPMVYINGKLYIACVNSNRGVDHICITSSYVSGYNDENFNYDAGLNLISNLVNTNYDYSIDHMVAFGNNLIETWDYRTSSGARKSDIVTKYNQDDGRTILMNNRLPFTSYNFYNICNGILDNSEKCYAAIKSAVNGGNTIVYIYECDFTGSDGQYSVIGSFDSNCYDYANIIIINKCIYIFIGKYVYKYNKDNNSITRLMDTICEINWNRMTLLNKDDNIVYYLSNKSIYKYNVLSGENTLIIKLSDSGYTSNILSDDIKYNITFNDAIFFDNNGNASSPMYYGDGSQWIKFKN